MIESKEKLLLKSKVDNKLQRIANILLLNSSFIDNLGLLNGKMGIAIFFYHYANYLGNNTYRYYAGELIDEIYEDINKNTPLDFANGLTGIGRGIEYLVEKKFVEAETDEALSEIDTTIYRNCLYRPFLLENDNDLFGYGLYFISRLREHENENDNLSTLFKKQHLIYLTDDCERILIQKSYLSFNLHSLSIDTINSFMLFLLEIHRLKLFPMKVERLFHSLPEYIESFSPNSDDTPEQSLLIMLTERIIHCVNDTSIKKLLKTILKNKDGKKPEAKAPEDFRIDCFIKKTWQHLVYTPYIREDNSFQYDASTFFLNMDNDDYWNMRFEKLNKDNLGLTGLAGLGLGMLELNLEVSKQRL